MLNNAHLKDDLLCSSQKGEKTPYFERKLHATYGLIIYFLNKVLIFIEYV